MQRGERSSWRTKRGSIRDTESKLFSYDKLWAIPHTYLIFDIQIQIQAFLKERSGDKSFRFVLDNSLIFIELFDTIPNILFSFALEKDKVKNKIHFHSLVLGMRCLLLLFVASIGMNVL